MASDEPVVVLEIGNAAAEHGFGDVALQRYAYALWANTFDLDAHQIES